MTVSGSIYFLGRYRPAYFEGSTPETCAARMLAAVSPVRDPALKRYLFSRIREGRAMIARDNYAAWSAEHCNKGVSFARRPHDPFLDEVTAKLPPCPGLDYAGAVNA